MNPILKSVIEKQEDKNNHSKRKGNIMSELVVIGFDNEHTAFEMRAELAKLQKEYLIEMEDVVVVTKDDKGKVLKTSLTADKEEALRKVLE